jgi:hypothetical protein
MSHASCPGDVTSNHGDHDNSELLEGVPALAEAMERVDLTDRHLEDIAVNVLEMAMEKEQHLDCLGQVTQSLDNSIKIN